VKKDIFFFTDFDSINATYNAHINLIERLKNEYREVIFIDTNPLKIFSNKKLKKKIFLNGNFISFNSKFKFIKYFSKKKNKILINNFGKDLNHLFIFVMIKVFSLAQIKVQNIDVIPYTRNFSNTNFFKKFFFYIKKIESKLINIFCGLGILPKVDILFLTNLQIYKKNKNFNILKNIFSFYKKHILVNSSTFSLVKKNKSKIKKEYILYIDYNIKHKDNLKYGEKINQKVIKNHYRNVKFVLKKLSNFYNLKVLVSIHPLYSLKKTKFHLKNYKVYKNQSIELINKAKLICLFNSTVVHYGYLLNKDIIYFNTNKLGSYISRELSNYPNKSNGVVIDIDNCKKIDIKKINNQLIKDKINQKNFNNKYLKPDKDVDPLNKIIFNIRKLK
tara:strand:+ start:10853 stop:12019 length:1167 start_codon:yes stop_codon:yes gene_type:complete